MHLIKCLLILPTLAMKQKLCIHCKYFSADKNSIKFSKCEMFPKVENKFNYLVTGVEEEEYNYCFTSRSHDDMCGEQGDMFKRKHISKYKSP